MHKSACDRNSKNGILSGFAALRAPHPSSPARRGGTKQIEAQRPAAFRAFSVQGLTGAGLPTALYEKSPAQSAELQFVCGERGIRTPGPVKINGFQDRRIRPLCHLSKVECYFAPCHVFREMDCKDKYFFRNRKRLGGKSVKNIENGGSGRWIADKNDYLARCIENTSNTQEY